jgi:hypothetical protein
MPINFDLFKKKPAAAAPAVPAAPSAIPLDQVISLRQQGYPDDQISQYLQGQGYSPQQVYDALAQAAAAPVLQPYAPAAPAASPAPAPMPEQPHEPMNPMARGAPGGFEEVAESIIEEKWHELSRELGKITEWKEQMGSRMDKMEQSVSELRSNLENLHRAIVARIAEYDKSLLDVGTEIKAMERVFSKALPELTESISELGRITKGAKADALKAAPKKA